MTKPKSKRKPRWPDYIDPQRREDIFALGMISLNYGLLEHEFQGLFRAACGMSEIQVSALFPRMQNDTRQKTIEQIIDQEKFPAPLKAAISHFIGGFVICAANRHSVMHSHEGGVFIEGRRSSIILAKFTRSGERLVCRATLPALQEIADSMNVIRRYGNWVRGVTWTYRDYLREGKGAWYVQQMPRALLEKPPLPRELDWQSDLTLQNAPHPPQPFRA